MPFWHRTKDPLQLQLEAELARVGTVTDPDDIYPVVVDKIRSRSGPKTARLSGRIWNYGSIGWEGDAEEALAALRALPDGAGPPHVWSTLYPNTHELTLWKELDRVGVTERRIARSHGDRIVSNDLSNRPHCVGIEYGDDARLFLRDEMLPRYTDVGRNQVSRITGEVRKVWSGTIEEALDRLGPMPDDSGLEAFWIRFPDADEPGSTRP